MNVHGVAPDEVEQMIFQLRGAIRIDATEIGGVFFAFELVPADGASFGDFVRRGVFGTLAQLNAAHARNNFAALIDADRVTDTHVERVDKILVVKRGAFNPRAVQVHGVKNCGRSNSARAPDA